MKWLKNIAAIKLMSGQTLVLKIVEYNTNDSKKVESTVYLFYDRDYDTFGLRGNVVNKTDDDTNYSFYCDSESDVANFIKMQCSMSKNMSVHILKYDDLPTDSDRITYDVLVDDDIKSNEIAAFDYDDGKCFQDTYYKKSDLVDYIKAIKTVYNVYKR